MSTLVTRRAALKSFASVTALTSTVGLAAAAGELDQPDFAASTDLSHIQVPDTASEAVQAIKTWLTARGIPCPVNNGGQSLRLKKGWMLNLYPVVAKDDLDRLIVATFYTPQDKEQGREPLAQLATKLNTEQNILQIYITKDYFFGVRAYMTFWNDLSACQFDAFLDLFVATTRRYILSHQEALKLLK